MHELIEKLTVSNRKFQHRGVLVHELITRNQDGLRVVWVREDAEKMAIEGLGRNPCFKSDPYRDSPESEDVARTHARNQFDRYWGLSEIDPCQQP